MRREKGETCTCCTFTSMRVCPTVVGPLWALGCPVCCRCFFTCWSHLPFWRVGSASFLCVGEPGGDCASGWGCSPRRSFSRWPSRSSLDWLLMSLRPHTPDFGVPDNLVWAAGATGADRRRRIWLHSTALGGTSSAGWPRCFSSILRGWATPPCPPDPSLLRLLVLPIAFLDTCCSTGPLSDALRGLLTCNFLSLHEDPAPQTPIRMNGGQNLQP